MDSLTKKYSDRFWEERRLHHPHLCLLYDLVGDMLRVSQLPPDKYQAMQERLDDLHTFQAGEITLDIEEAEDLIQRNTNQRLIMELETLKGTCVLQELLIGSRLWLREISHLATDLAKMYYTDMPLRQEQTWDTNVLEKM